MSEKPSIPDEKEFPKYTAFFSAYGGFLAGWAFFDLALEILIKRELKLETRETSIICGGISFGAKINVLLALLARDEANAKGIQIIRKVRDTAERNSFAHGFLSFTNGKMHLVKQSPQQKRSRRHCRALGGLERF